MSAVRIVAAIGGLQADAIAWLARDAPDPAAVVAELQTLYASGTLHANDLLVAIDEHGTVHGAIFAQRLTGAMAELSLPATDDPSIAAELVKSLTKQLQISGRRLIQVIVPLPEPSGIAALQLAGFVHITDLSLRARDLSDRDRNFPAPVVLEAVRAELPGFAEVLLETYQNTQDLPELDVILRPQELLDSSRSPGAEFFRVLNEGNWIGVLQLGLNQSDSDSELIYMGLRPGWRRRGLGYALAKAALCLAWERGFARLQLSVDVRNQPAQRVYDQLGFRPIGRSAVWLKNFPP